MALSPMVTERYVLHVQRRIFRGDGAWQDGLSSQPDSDLPNALGSLLFAPIAGDTTQRLANTGHMVNTGQLTGLQFGMLDSDIIQRMAVVTITNPMCTEQPGCLADLRMGASAVSNRLCETCHETHHNCLLCSSMVKNNKMLQQTLLFFSSVNCAGVQKIVLVILVGFFYLTPS